ncbi:MAG: lipoyl protein ligase domain-containing protein [Acidimicrobiales bacterium]
MSGVRPAEPAEPDGPVWSASLPAGRWQVRRVAGSVAELHGIDPTGRSLEDRERPAAWVCAPSGAAVVLGSTQQREVVDAAVADRRGLDVVVRRSGGGAVLVVPDDVVWVDLWVPRDDVLWDDDVAVATHWVGELWADVAVRLGVAARAHRGPMQADALGRLVCFVGVGPGEVMVGDSKLVGISQRRVRAGARFQCQWVRRWAPDALLDSLRIDDADVRRRVAAAGVGVDVDPDRLVAVLTEALAER